MASSAMRDLMRKKKAEIKSRSGGDFKPASLKNGRNEIRLLPSWRKPSVDGEPVAFWAEFGQHWVKKIPPTGGKAKVEAVHVCPEATYGQECLICEVIGRGVSSAKDIGDDDRIDLIKESNASQKYLVNALLLNDKELANTPTTFAFGPQIFEQICDIWQEYDNEGIDILDPDEGVTLIINRSGSGMDTSYTVQASPKGRSAIEDKSVLENIPNIDEQIAVEFAKATEKKALRAICDVTGVLPSAFGLTGAHAISGSTVPALTSGIADDDIEHVDSDDLADLEDELVDEEVVTDAEIIEAEEKPVAKAGKPKAEAKPKVEAKPSVDDTDDFDSLLSELDELDAAG